MGKYRGYLWNADVNQNWTYEWNIYLELRDRKMILMDGFDSLQDLQVVYCMKEGGK